MSDITKCDNAECPIRDQCYRFEAAPAKCQFYSQWTPYQGQNGSWHCDGWVPAWERSDGDE